MMLKKNQNIFRLSEIEESIIIEFSFEDNEDEIVLVVVLESNVLSKTREELIEEKRIARPDLEFARFRFMNVSRFQRKHVAKMYLDQFNYAATEDGSNAIYGIRVSNSLGRYKFNACLTGLGDVQFYFEDVEFRSKNCRIVRTKKDVLYVDMSNRNVMNFWNPFQDIIS